MFRFEKNVSSEIYVPTKICFSHCLSMTFNGTSWRIALTEVSYSTTTRSPASFKINNPLTVFVTQCNFLFSIRWGWGQQLTSVATGKSGATGWRGGPGFWPPSPPPSQRLGRRCLRGRRAHVHHEWVGWSHGIFTRRCRVRWQLCFTFTRLLDGGLTCLQPKAQETGEEDVMMYLHLLYSNSENHMRWSEMEKLNWYHPGHVVVF